MPLSHINPLSTGNRGQANNLLFSRAKPNLCGNRSLLRCPLEISSTEADNATTQALLSPYSVLL